MGANKVFLFLILLLQSGPISPQAIQALQNIRGCEMSPTDRDFIEATASTQLTLKRSGESLVTIKYIRFVGIPFTC